MGQGNIIRGRDMVRTSHKLVNIGFGCDVRFGMYILTWLLLLEASLLFSDLLFFQGITNVHANTIDPRTLVLIFSHS